MSKKKSGPPANKGAKGSLEPKEKAFKLISENRKARHNYEILEQVEAGIMLTGTEVKSCRAGKAQLVDAYGVEIRGEVFLQHADISPYSHGNILNHEPKRLRKLLLHRREIDRLLGKLRERGLTLVPLKLYFKGAHVKVLMGLGKGKKLHDKRDTLRKKAVDRETQQSFKNKRRV